LSDLGRQYTDKGYAFIVHPGPENLPPFLGSYTPDAIALKPGANVAIEVLQRPRSADRRPLTELRQLFDGHNDWQFVVSHMGSDPLQRLTIPAASLADMQRQMEDVEALAAQGQHRAAFVMAWSLLEAALHRIESDRRKPLMPGTVVQSLAMLGYIEPENEQRIRPLVELRNRVVHGDLGAEPTADDIEAVLSAVQDALVDG
jgi:uncharacterized protein YutE (UPF0331/DUF86 family)